MIRNTATGASIKIDSIIRKRRSSIWSGNSTHYINLILVVMLILRIIEHVFLYSNGFVSLTADEFARTILAARWAQKPFGIWNGAWLPLHVYLLGILLKLNWNLLWVPRFMTIIFGLGSLLLMYILGQLLTDSVAGGLVSAYLLAVNPVHLWLSSTPLSEMPYTALWLTAIIAAVGYLRHQKPLRLLISAGTLGIANGFRFEGWFVSMLFLLYVAVVFMKHWKSGQLRYGDAIIYSVALALPSLMPIMWLIGNYVMTGDLLAFAKEISSYKQHYYGTARQYGNYLFPLLRIDPVMLIAAPIGWILVMAKRPRQIVLVYTSLAIVPFAVFIYLHGGQIEPLGNYLRYLAPFIFVLYPIVAYAFMVVTHALFSSPRWERGALVLLLLVLGFWQTHTAFHFVNDPAAQGLPVGLKIASLRTAQPQLKTDDVIIELSYWQYLAIQTGANDVNHILYDRALDLQTRNSTSFFVTNLAALQRCIASKPVAYVVVKSSDLQNVVEYQLALKSITQVGDYRFYRIPAEWWTSIANNSCELY